MKSELIMPNVWSGLRRWMAKKEDEEEVVVVAVVVVGIGLVAAATLAGMEVPIVQVVWVY